MIKFLKKNNINVDLGIIMFKEIHIRVIQNYGGHLMRD